MKSRLKSTITYDKEYFLTFLSEDVEFTVLICELLQRAWASALKPNHLKCNLMFFQICFLVQNVFPWVLQDCGFCDSNSCSCKWWFLQWVAKLIFKLRSCELTPWLCCVIASRRDHTGKDTEMSELLPDPAEAGQGTRRFPRSESAEINRSPHQRRISVTSDWQQVPLWSLLPPRHSTFVTVRFYW